MTRKLGQPYDILITNLYYWYFTSEVTSKVACIPNKLNIVSYNELIEKERILQRVCAEGLRRRFVEIIVLSKKLA